MLELLSKIKAFTLFIFLVSISFSKNQGVFSIDDDAKDYNVGIVKAVGNEHIYWNTDEETPEETCIKMSILGANKDDDCLNQIPIDDNYKCCYMSYKIQGNNKGTCLLIQNNKESLDEVKKKFNDTIPIQIICDAKYSKFNLIFILLIILSLL